MRNMAPSLSCVENRAIPHSLQRSSVLAELQIHAHKKGLEAGRCGCSIRCSILWTQWLLFSRSKLRPVRYMTDSWLFNTNDMLAIAHRSCFACHLRACCALSRSAYRTKARHCHQCKFTSIKGSTKSWQGYRQQGCHTSTLREQGWSEGGLMDGDHP